MKASRVSNVLQNNFLYITSCFFWVDFLSKAFTVSLCISIFAFEFQLQNTKRLEESADLDS